MREAPADTGVDDKTFALATKLWLLMGMQAGGLAPKAPPLLQRQHTR
jgi:hypothetical protein